MYTLVDAVASCGKSKSPGEDVVLRNSDGHSGEFVDEPPDATSERASWVVRLVCLDYGTVQVPVWSQLPKTLLLWASR
jgi:hypothetical protein